MKRFRLITTRIRQIVNSFLQCRKGEPDDEEDTETLHSGQFVGERVTRAMAWVSETTTTWDDPNLADTTGERNPTSDHDEIEVDALEFGFAKHVETLDNSDAYQWLLASIRCEIALSSSQPDPRATLRHTISERLPHARVSRHRQPRSYEFLVESD